MTDTTTQNEASATNKMTESTEDVLESLGIPVEDGGRREQFLKHVEVHKYLLDRERHADTDWPEAIASWSTHVAEPIREAIGDGKVKSSFPRRKIDGLFLEVSDHWHFMKQKDPVVTANEAAVQYAHEYGNPVSRFIGGSLLGPVAKWFRKETARADAIERNFRRQKDLYDSDTRNWPIVP